MNNIVAKQCLWPNCVVEKYFEMGLLLSQNLSFKACKTYITTTYSVNAGQIISSLTLQVGDNEIQTCI